MQLVAYANKPKPLRILTAMPPPARLGWLAHEQVVDADLARHWPRVKEAWAAELVGRRPFWPATLEKLFSALPFVRTAWLRVLDEVPLTDWHDASVMGEPVSLPLAEVELRPPWSLRRFHWQSMGMMQKTTELLPYPTVWGCEAEIPLRPPLQIEVGIVAGMASGGQTAPVTTLAGYTLWAAMRTAKEGTKQSAYDRARGDLCLGPCFVTESSLPEELAWEVRIGGELVQQGTYKMGECIDSLATVRELAWDIQHAEQGDAIGIQWASYRLASQTTFSFRVEGFGELAPRLRAGTEE